MATDHQPLSIQQRRRRNREQIIEDIILIARDMMQADGAASLSFNAIARQLGIKPPSLYTYFDSKHAIYDELFRRGWLLFREQGKAYFEKDGTVHEKLEFIFELYLRFAQENPDYFQIMFQRPIPDFVPSDENLALSLEALNQFTEYLRDILTSEQLDPGIPLEQARDLCIALMHGLTEQHLANNPELPIGEGRYGSLIPQAVNTLLKAWSVET